MPRLDTIVRLAAGVEAEPCDLFDGMAWPVDRSRLHEAKPPPGGFEVEVGDRWEPA